MYVQDGPEWINDSRMWLCAIRTHTSCTYKNTKPVNVGIEIKGIHGWKWLPSGCEIQLENERINWMQKQPSVMMTFDLLLVWNGKSDRIKKCVCVCAYNGPHGWTKQSPWHVHDHRDLWVVRKHNVKHVLIRTINCRFYSMNENGAHTKRGEKSQSPKQ